MIEGICSVEDCDRRVVNVRGYCGMHYQRWLKYGVDGLGITRSIAASRGPLIDQFWAKIDRTPMCWLPCMC